MADDHTSLTSLVMDATDVGLLLINRQGQTIFCNAAARALFTPPDGKAPSEKDILAANVAGWPQPADLSRLGSADNVARKFEPIQTPSGATASLGITPLAENFLCQLNDLTLFTNDGPTSDALAPPNEPGSLATMGHEMRTPLNAIIGFAEVIKSQAIGPVGTAAYVEYAADIASSGHHLLTIVNEIMAAATAKALGQTDANGGEQILHETNCDLRDIVDTAVKIVSGTLPGRTIALRTDVEDDLPPIKADPMLLRQVAINLLSNAIRHTPDSGDVAISAGLDDQGRPMLRVADTGSGIDPAVIPDLTKPFTQGEQPTAAGSGSGLGLFLVARHVALHGGELAFDSHPGAGTTVTVTLPSERLLS